MAACVRACVVCGTGRYGEVRMYENIDATADDYVVMLNIEEEVRKHVPLLRN
jgi:hypothetical protein